MPRKRDLNKEAAAKEAEHKVSAVDFEDLFDSLEDDVVLKPDYVDDALEDDEDDDIGEIDEAYRTTPAFQALQEELDAIRKARKKLTVDMEAPELDRDERDTLKARGTLLDSRERSAREELKLFHKHELTQLGQIRKVRIVIEDALDSTGRKFEGLL